MYNTASSAVPVRSHVNSHVRAQRPEEVHGRKQQNSARPPGSTARLLVESGPLKIPDDRKTRPG